MREMFTKDVSTSLVIAKVLTACNISVSFNGCPVNPYLLETPFIDSFFGRPAPSSTPTVSWANAATSSVRD